MMWSPIWLLVTLLDSALCANVLASFFYYFVLFWTNIQSFLHRILLDNTRENLAKLGVILVYFYISRGYLYWDLFHVVSFFYSNDSLTCSLLMKTKHLFIWPNN